MFLRRMMVAPSRSCASKACMHLSVEWWHYWQRYYETAKPKKAVMPLASFLGVLLAATGESA